MGCLQSTCNIRLVENPQALPIEVEIRSKTESLKNKQSLSNINEKEIIEVILKETDWKKLKTQKIYGLSDHNHYDSIKKFNSEINGDGKSFDIEKLKLEMGFDEQFLDKYKKKMGAEEEKIGKVGGIVVAIKSQRHSLLEVHKGYGEMIKNNENNATVKEISLFEKGNLPSKTHHSAKEDYSNNVNTVKKSMRLESRQFSLESNSKKEKKKVAVRKNSLIDIKDDNDQNIHYDHTLSPTTKIKIKAEIFIHLKQGSIDSAYTVGDLLGEGAYGKVNTVTHKVSGILRAMKTIKKKDLPKEDEAKLFSEMNLLKTLDHPNIVKLIELFQDDKNYYLITEYCSGGELFDRLKKLNQFSEDMAADIMKQLLSAVAYLHSQNVVHRDLKPENIVFESKRKDANLKIIDFGTSRRFEEGKKLTKLVGTPYFLAPEVINKSYDERCDVWSCGIILYILLCGYPPFFGRTQEEIMKKVKEGKYKFEGDDWKNVSPEAKHMIKLMLEPDYTKRISSVKALNDKWITANTSSKRFLSAKCLQNLSNFHASTKLNTAILTFIANNVLTFQDKEEIRKTFQALDKDCDGYVSNEELLEGYSKLYKDKEKARKEVNRILKDLGCEDIQRIDYTQFIVASVNREKLFSTNKLEQAFKMFDQNGDGNISKTELETIMGGTQIPEKLWKMIVSQCDSNSDGEISYLEFVNILLSKIGN